MTHAKDITASAMAACLDTLAKSAVLAPSGDNTQPWRIEVNQAARSLVIVVDESRDRSPMNAGQRMSRIAVGAAVENVFRTAAHNELTVDVTKADCRSVTIAISGRCHALEIPAPLVNRCTNRRLYDCREIRTDIVHHLVHQTPDAKGLHTVWITDRHMIRHLASVIQRADSLLFSTHVFRHAFLDNVRFDRPNSESVAEGLPIGALELSIINRITFRMLPRIPDWLATCLGVGPAVGRQSRKLVRSASGICLGIAEEEGPEVDYAVGRSLQKAWLALHEQGLAVQPMMSIPVLDNAIAHPEETQSCSKFESYVREILRDLVRVCPSIGDRRPCFLLRFGWADHPITRAGRRIWEGLSQAKATN